MLRLKLDQVERHERLSFEISNKNKNKTLRDGKEVEFQLFLPEDVLCLLIILPVSCVHSSKTQTNPPIKNRPIFFLNRKPVISITLFNPGSIIFQGFESISLSA